MTQPSGHERQQPGRPGLASAAARDKQLDQPGEGNGSWTVDKVDGSATTGVNSVAAPVQPPELHPGAAAALPKLLKRFNDHRTDNSKQENG
ncbi:MULTISPECIES: hypothetical protein [unclassified Micromonospora]|uniref:hypothetical protein n=1 Tax=Micromonospora sp. NPDC005087 TaxID=3364225 RepID=UPI0036AB0701